MTEPATERPCIDCGDPTLNAERCRDCDIVFMLDQMHCKTCDRMRHNGSEIAVAFWGERCTCEVKS